MAPPIFIPTAKQPVKPFTVRLNCNGGTGRRFLLYFLQGRWKQGIVSLTFVMNVIYPGTLARMIQQPECGHFRITASVCILRLHRRCDSDKAFKNEDHHQSAILMISFLSG